MQFSRNKLFALLSLLIVSSGLMSVAVNAVAVPNRKTAAYISVAPKLIGVGQQLTVNAWIYPAPAGPSFFAQTLPRMGFEGVTVTFTRPDGSKDTFVPSDPSLATHGEQPGLTEAVGNMYFFYTPTQAGTWSVTFSFPGQTFTTPPSPDTVYYEPSTSQAFTFTVQEDKVVESGILTGWPWSPLPTGYWERPVNINNREWSQISGDWLMSGYDALVTRFNPYTTAPNTAHIIWKKQIVQAGIIGGDWGSQSYAGGGGAPGVIMNGKVYINDPTGGTFTCVDLRTGELLYRKTGTITGGQRLKALESFPGVLGEAEKPTSGMLWDFTGTTLGSSIYPETAPKTDTTTGTWKRYDPLYGNLIQTITKVSTSLVTISYTDGNPEFYITQRWGWNTTIPNRWAGIYLIKWSYDKVTGNDWSKGIVWNVTLRQPDGTAPSDGMRTLQGYPYWGANVVVAMSNVMEDTMYGYDMTTGQRLWATNLGFINILNCNLGPNGPIVAFDSTTMTYVAFDVKTGNKLWVSDPPFEYPWGSTYERTASGYGNFYLYNTDGHAYSFDIATGKLKWKTEKFETNETVYGTWPSFYVLSGAAGSTVQTALADGKFFFTTGISWGAQPFSRFHRLRALDANTGQLVWDISGAIKIDGIADGYLVGTDGLNGITYVFGKGQTATTLSASPKVAASGSAALIEGSVMDVSPAQPNTPAVAKESMSAWMDYLHMQNATLINNPPITKGVPVLLQAVSSDGSVTDIGTVTTDAGGHFTYDWTPQQTGLYTITAYFAGDDSYWSSWTETGLSVKTAQTSDNGAAQPGATADYTLVLAGMAIAIIILAILVVYQIFRKK